MRQKYEETEGIAWLFYAQHIPAVAALKIESHFVHVVGEHMFLVYPFLEGKVVPVEQLSLPHAEIIGGLFGDIHACKLHHSLSDSTPHYDAFDDEHWKRLVVRYNNPKLTSLLPTLLDWNARYRASLSRLNQEVLISHRDLHASNVLWDGTNPSIIDWESAGYTNPVQEIVGFALEWSGIIQSVFNRALFVHLITAYRKRIPHSQTLPRDAFYGWLGNSVMGWTEFNLRRALEDSFHENEQKRGVKLLDKTMIPCLSYINANLTELHRAIEI